MAYVAPPGQITITVKSQTKSTKDLETLAHNCDLHIIFGAAADILVVPGDD